MEHTVNLLLFVLLILNRGKVHGGFVGEDKATLLEILVTSDEHSVEHGLVQEEVAHPFRDDDVEFLDGELNLFELSFHEGNGCDVCLRLRHRREI